MFDDDNYQHTKPNGANRLMFQISPKKQIEFILFGLKCVKYHIQFYYTLQNLEVLYRHFECSGRKIYFSPGWFSLSITSKMRYHNGRGVSISTLRCTALPLLRQISFEFFQETASFENNEFRNPCLSICYGKFKKMLNTSFTPCTH